MNAAISCDDLARLMASAQRFAVFDVRERGEYNQCQIPDTTSLPRSQIEFRVAELVPDRKVQLIVYDEGGARAPLAAGDVDAPRLPTCCNTRRRLGCMAKPRTPYICRR